MKIVINEINKYCFIEITVLLFDNNRNKNVAFIGATLAVAQVSHIRARGKHCPYLNPETIFQATKGKRSQEYAYLQDIKDQNQNLSHHSIRQ
ncbi:MAG: hypothetical protein ACTHOB_02705 [Ginsengibacter sp.]